MIQNKIQWKKKKSELSTIICCDIYTVKSICHIKSRGFSLRAGSWRESLLASYLGLNMYAMRAYFVIVVVLFTDDAL